MKSCLQFYMKGRSMSRLAHTDLIYKYAQSIKESPLVIRIVGKLRRFYLVHFRKDYVKRQLKLRRGECRQCAQCCSLVFTCPMLTRRKLCRTYRKWRWKVCTVFPIDRRDIDDVGISGVQCGYFFKQDEYNDT
ncbi:hypothetical protein BMS3Bbin05_01801 [bacterium BMS3Bbin05]|nr:hypothetical protein BMS3Bbin05_01801 [bacterium BMS3Bbin05]